jgi:PAS domain S-box-containing protein
MDGRLRIWVLTSEGGLVGAIGEALAGCVTSVGLAAPEGERPDLIVLGTEQDWRAAHARHPHTPLVPLLARAEDAAPAVASGVYDFLVPPHDREHVEPRLSVVVQRLAEERALWRALDSADVALEVTDAEARMLRVGAAFERLTGYRAEEAVGRTPAELLRSGVHPPEYYAAGMAALRAGAPWKGLLVSRRKDGGLFSAIVSVAPAQGGPLTRYFAVRRETTGEDAAVARARVLMESALDAILVADFESALYIDANPAALALLGYSLEELRALTGRAITSPGQDEIVAALSASMRETGRAGHDRMLLRRRDGSDVWAAVRMASFESAGHKEHAVIIRDVSHEVARERELERSYRELHQAHAQLAHAGALAAVGELAAGVAHEVNNPTTYVMLSLSEARHWLEQLRRGAAPSPGELDALLAEALDGARRVAAIVRDLRTFARFDALETRDLDLADAARVALRMTKGELRHQARVVTELMSAGPVAGDANRISQVIINLLLNAAQALESAPLEARVITVRTRRDGAWAVVEVRDSGPGIAPEVRGRIFEPFFTTKARGQGTGLGLSLCRDIVEAHGGTIEVESELGHGAVFTVRLPTSTPRTPRPRSLAPPSPTTRPRVLVVDDDPLVLRGVCRALSRTCDAVAAQSGAAALAVIAADAAFDLVICDLMMPVMDGVAVYEAAVAAAPHLRERFIYLSGGAVGERARRFLDTVAPPFVLKPVSADELERLVAAWLAGDPAPSG